MVKDITSTNNLLIKKIISLQEKSRARKKEGLFIVEGQREISLAIKGGYTIKTLLFTSEILNNDTSAFITDTTEVIKITTEVYQKIAYRASTEGVIAIVASKITALENLKFQNQNPLLLIAEAPEKPGNIGALLRTADAANVDAVIIANPKTDLYNPNIIRSSVGCVFTNQVAMASTADIIAFLKERDISIYSAILQQSQPYYSQDYKKGCALVVGTEATGLSQEWRDASTANIHIPMQGAIDSLNVSVAAAVLLFEAKRQRGF